MNASDPIIAPGSTFGSAPHGCLSPSCQGVEQLHLGGRGVVALRAIQKGEVLAAWGGTTMTTDAVLALPAGLRRLALQVDDGFFLVSEREGPADWINHSCNPNAGVRGQVVLVAMRDIGAGESICFDYAMTDSAPYDEFQCGCGALECRGRITCDDWREPSLWTRYDGYFSTYLAERIRRLRDTAAWSGRVPGLGTRCAGRAQDGYQEASEAD